MESDPLVNQTEQNTSISVPGSTHEAPAPRAPSPLKQIRTFQGDIAEALHTKQASVISLKQAEDDRNKARDILAPALKAERLEATAAQAKQQVLNHEAAKGWARTLLLILGTLVLLGFGGAGVW